MSNGRIATAEHAPDTTAMIVPDAEMGLTTKGGFELIQRVASCLGASTLVPKEYQGKQNLPNVVIALEMAHRIGITPLAVMQNLYIVHGKPSWSSAFIIASINSCRRFNPLRFDMQGTPGTDGRTCIAWTTETEFPLPRGSQTLKLALAAGMPVLEGSPVSIDMAKKEGWYSKNGSKWPTMSEQMLRYRAATFFGRLYAPDLLMGIRPQDEVEDIVSSAVGNIIPTRLPAREIEAVEPPADSPTTVEATAEPVHAQPIQEQASQQATEPTEPPNPDPGHADHGEGAADKITELRDRISECGDVFMLAEVRGEIDRAKYWIGEEAHQDLHGLAEQHQARLLQTVKQAESKRRK